MAKNTGYGLVYNVFPVSGNKSPNNVATTLVGMLYRMGFEQSQLGIASAIGVIFLLIVLAVNIVQLWINGTIGSKKGE